MRSKLLRTRIAALTALVTVLAGCGSSQVHGNAVSEGASSAPTTVAQLNTGDYPTAPLPPLGTAGAMDVGRRLEAQLMAPNVVGPWQVDESLTQGNSPAGALILSKEDLGLTLWAFFAAGAGGQPFLLGFVADRHNADKAATMSLRNGVLRFADDQAATDAVAGMTNTAMVQAINHNVMPILTEPPRAMPVPAHPASSAILLTYNEDDSIKHEVTVLTARGPYVLFQVVQHPKGPDAAIDLASRTIDLQLPLIDGFQPSNPAFFAQLPLDPTGLVARTLPTSPAGVTPMSGSAYPPAGALHAEANPVAVGPQLSQAGVDQVSIGQATLYQAKDAAGATALAQALGDDAGKLPTSQAAAAVPGLPGSRCLLVSDAAGLVPKYLCLATFDRYAFKTLARDFTRAQQQLAAQYRMLGG